MWSRHLESTALPPALRVDSHRNKNVPNDQRLIRAAEEHPPWIGTPTGTENVRVSAAGERQHAETALRSTRDTASRGQVAEWRVDLVRNRVGA